MYKAIVSKLGFGLFVICGIYTFLLMPLPWFPARPATGQAFDIQPSSQDNVTVRAYRSKPATDNNIRVILVPSAGREASDFNELVTVLTGRGYETITIDGHGINGTDLPNFTDLLQVAQPVVELLEQDSKPTVLIGHAYGNRVVRAASSARPGTLNGVILLAAGGYNEIEPRANHSLKSVFNPLIIALKREGHVRQAFFAERNHAQPLKHWKRGWHTKTAIMQGKAKVSVSDPNWESAGGVPMLVVQAAQDRIAPKKETADVLKARFRDQVAVTVIENAGHAMLPEQPDAVAKAVLEFLALYHPV